MKILFVKNSGKLFFEEVMIRLRLFLGYQPHSDPNNPILFKKYHLQKLTILIYYISKFIFWYYILSTHVHNKYINVIVTKICEKIA